MNSKVKSFYFEKKEQFASSLKSVSSFLKRMIWYRLLVFISIFVPVFIFGFQNRLALVFTVFLIVVFFLLVKKNISLEKEKRKLIVLKKLADDELLALEHEFSHFENGKEFLDTDHFFSYDLDLFGEGSLFQFVNRTSTHGGRKCLADWFIKPEFSKMEIEAKQQAIKELAKKHEWRLQFLASGLLFKETEKMAIEIKNWSEMELGLLKSNLIKWLIKFVPVLTFLALISYVTGFTGVLISIMVLIQWGLMFLYWKKINWYFNFFCRKSELLEKYMQLLQLIEEGEFKSEYLLSMQKKVQQPVSASKIFRELKSLVKNFEYRGNIIVGFFLNSMLLWDISCVYKLWNWHRENHKKLVSWIEVISQMDALISLANFANNHQGYVFPTAYEGDFIFNSKQLGHPLLNPIKRVNNDMEISGWPKVMIITGANMAGKSTFLRTVGVNLVLARIGAPVCAKEMVFTPVKIYTNMRTTDSLLKDESYFFAELKRIKGVLDQLQNGEQFFVILDEMLKGTNSVDKLHGSRELIRKLLKSYSVSLIATHDLKLSEMEYEFPDYVFNKCFEIRIENDELAFDYKLYDGVTQTMNATFLMKKMGII
ncbi:MAG: hypothetical protein LBV47_00385 [Bacteroidales bacterium]|jgi:drug/metabolite transporter superfamily protein YnfA|nr:hypothetical protein [Bacteroidales bacterium]